MTVSSNDPTRFRSEPAPEGTPFTPAGGLSSLASVRLEGRDLRMLESALTSNGGPAPWQRRKGAEARDILALAALAAPGRMSVEVLDLEETLRAVVALRVPVPLRPLEDGGLPVARGAILGLTYPIEALARPMPGYAFVQILSPAGVWHANVADRPGQPLCLGAQLPAGLPLRETVLLAYGALSMQTVMVDEADPAGVLNAEAAVWWQRNLHRVPLSAVPFLLPDPPASSDDGPREGPKGDHR